MKDELLPLRHILDAVRKIERYCKDKLLKDLERDEQLLDSILINFVVIGEQAAHLPDSFRVNNPDIPWHEMIGMRNIISHDYFSIKPEIV